MPELSPRPDSADAPAPARPAAYPGTPAWVKIALVVVLLLLVALVAGATLGLHTPGGPAGHGV